MKNWLSLDDLFMELNKKTNYLILRNYENLGEQISTDLHPDIDFLCEDKMAFIEIIGSEKRTRRKEDSIHQKIMIADTEVDIDIRTIGDGYYPEDWEKNMLRTRILYNDLYYVMNEENYHYSLMYHVLIQKKKVSDDYRNKLQVWEKSEFERDKYLQTLSDYMKKNKYLFTYPSFDGGIFNIKGVSRELIEKSMVKKIKRILYPIKHELGMDKRL